MKNKIQPKPSASLVLSRVPSRYTENDVKELFKEYLPLENVKFHYTSPNLFTHKVTVTFPSIEAAEKAGRMIGKHVGKDNLKIQYSLIPNNFSNILPRGSLELKEMKDDPDVPTDIKSQEYFIDEWNSLKEVKPELPPPQAKYLGLRYNCINSFEANLPLLTELNLKGNDLEEFPPSLSFPNLKLFDVSYNLLKCLPDFSIFAPNIQKINASSNQLTEIHPSLSDLKDLTYIDVSHNRIKEVPRLPPTVSHLLVQSNVVTTFAETKPLPLHELSLWKNQIEEIPLLAYGSVEGFSFCHNKLKSIPLESLAKTITKLNLCMNELNSLPPDLFKIKTLRELKLFHNQITEIPSTFSNSYLEVLDISENPIDHLPMVPSQLQDLKINFCNFSDLDHCIPKVNSIIKLHAIANHLKSIPSIPYVEELLVADNELTEFPDLNIRSMVLMVVDVSHNKIKTIPSMRAPFLLLDLSYNQITSIPEILFNTRSHINLRGNPIKTELDLSNMRRICSLDVSNTDITILKSEEEDEEENNGYPSNMFELMIDYDDDQKTKPGDTVKVLVKTDKHEEALNYSVMIGTRSKMEDCIIIRKDLKPGISVYGLFDGHGGEKVARLAATSFPDILEDLDVINNETITKMCDDFQETITGMNETQGTTMDLVVVMKEERKILVSHIGDTKVALFANDGSVRFETLAQNAYMRSELERLRNEKIRLRKMRTSGTLAMSRSLGDIQIAGVLHKAEFSEIELVEDDRWLVIACDGIMDDVDMKSMSETLVKTNCALKASCLLRDMAYSRGSEDNISSIVIDLKPLFK